MARGLADETWYDCATCHREPQRLTLLGHDGPPQGMWDEHLITGEAIAICPMRLLLDADEVTRQEAVELTYTHFPLFKHGHLWAAGATSEQPAWWLDAMMELETLEHRKKVAYLRAQESEGES